MDLEQKKTTLIRAAYFAVMAIGAVLAAKYLWMVLCPFFLGFLIAYILRPVVGFFSRNSGVGRKGMAIAAAAVFYAVLACVLWLLGALLYHQAEKAVAELPALYEGSLKPALEQFRAAYEGIAGRLAPDSGRRAALFLSLDEWLEKAAVSASGWLGAVMAKPLKGIPGLMFTAVFTVLCSVMICIDYKAVTAFVMGQVPKRFHGVLLEARDYMAGAVLRIVRAYLILTGVTFGMLALGLWAMGVERCLATAGIIALLDLLPVIGSGVVLIPWGVLGFLGGDYLLGGGMLVLWAGVSVIRQVLEPRVVGNQIGLHPLATVVAMYGGVKLAGVWGLVLAPLICLLLQYLHEKEIIRLWRDVPA